MMDLHGPLTTISMGFEGGGRGLGSREGGSKLEIIN